MSYNIHVHVIFPLPQVSFFLSFSLSTSPITSCTCYNLHMCNYFKYTSIFDKLTCIWCTNGPKSFLFGTAQFSLWASGAVNYDHNITNCIKSLLIVSKCILNGTHTNHCYVSSCIHVLVTYTTLSTLKSFEIE